MMFVLDEEFIFTWGFLWIILVLSIVSYRIGASFCKKLNYIHNFFKSNIVTCYNNIFIIRIKLTAFLYFIKNKIFSVFNKLLYLNQYLFTNTCLLLDINN
jgi:hypothetical protein